MNANRQAGRIGGRLRSTPFDLWICLLKKKNLRAHACEARAFVTCMVADSDALQDGLNSSVSQWAGGALLSSFGGWREEQLRIAVARRAVGRLARRREATALSAWAYATSEGREVLGSILNSAEKWAGDALASSFGAWREEEARMRLTLWAVLRLKEVELGVAMRTLQANAAEVLSKDKQLSKSFAKWGKRETAAAWRTLQWNNRHLAAAWRAWSPVAHLAALGVKAAGRLGGQRGRRGLRAGVYLVWCGVGVMCVEGGVL
ncbi:hypothetical protein T492DRAFT_1145752 [Pavlovales sp. CCMP2436]|nr:hypothetical protein T492DRAFT_1145752 [Pavlovales sp. CCMP2436]